ncbi:Hypothetical_protein [Hexamita inflata]|uniref:Hypothetical_protein n=1 Tax=Hexamita inflata TaxID=28002 RepID=A0AA86UDG5_9EUKA|nr:Hypothetical protein HINF_LOCUS25023 [Hexamita inflata]
MIPKADASQPPISSKSAAEMQVCGLAANISETDKDPAGAVKAGCDKQTLTAGQCVVSTVKPRYIQTWVRDKAYQILLAFYRSMYRVSFYLDGFPQRQTAESEWIIVANFCFVTRQLSMWTRAQ